LLSVSMAEGGNHWCKCRETTAGAPIVDPTIEVNIAFVAVPAVVDDPALENIPVESHGSWSGTYSLLRPERPGCALRILTTAHVSMGEPAPP
jgi:hypothetical protein